MITTLQLAGLKSVISSCQLHSAFNTLGSASLYSQLCGVLAALTFSALVSGLASMIATRRRVSGKRKSRRIERSFNDPQAYKALLLAFVSLLFSSAPWGIVSGASSSARSRRARRPHATRSRGGVFSLRSSQGGVRFPSSEVSRKPRPIHSAFSGVLS